MPADTPRRTTRRTLPLPDARPFLLALKGHDDARLSDPARAEQMRQSGRDVLAQKRREREGRR